MHEYLVHPNELLMVSMGEQFIALVNCNAGANDLEVLKEANYKQ